jgi:NADPH:quinone reductase-like Zn-dependent oxidoreductase
MTDLPATMRAVALTEFGGPRHLALLELPVPAPAPDEVLIRVHTVAANRQDTFTMAGRAQARHPVPLPHVLGIDPAGVVVAMGAAVREPVVGTRVVVKPAIACGTCPTCLAGEDDACPSAVNVGVHRAGGMAEYVAVPATNAFPIPDGIGFPAATAIAHSFPVALQMLRERAGLRRGESVLVTGAGGAIGAASVQLAKAIGATVVAAAGGPERVEYVRSLGADAVIDYTATPDFAPAVRAVVPDGVDVYVESAGDPAIWAEAMAALGRRGRVVVCGSHAGGQVSLDLNWLFRTRASILGASGSSLRIMAEVLTMAGRGDIVPNIHTVLPLERAAEAFAILAARQNRGKVVLAVADPDA